MPQAQLQPAPFRVPLLDAQGQLVETWRRFFLSSQNLTNSLLLTVASLGGSKPSLMMPDDADQGDNWLIPGPAGIQGLPGAPGPPNVLAMFDEGDVGVEWFTGFPPPADSVLSPNVALLNRNPQTFTGANTFQQSGQTDLTIQAGGAANRAVLDLLPTGAAGCYINYGLALGSNDLNIFSNKTGVGVVVNINPNGAITFTGTPTQQAKMLSTSGLAEFDIIPSGTFNAYLGYGTAGGNDLHFFSYKTGINDAMILDQSGNLTNIGTARFNAAAAVGALSAKAIGTALTNGFNILTTSNDAFLELRYNGTSWQIGASYRVSEGYKPIAIFTSDAERARFFVGGGMSLGDTTDPGNHNLRVAGTVAMVGTMATYNNVATAGGGVPAIYGSGRATAQAGAVASVAAYTVGATDGSFLVSMNLLITAFTAGTVSGVVTYTDEGGTARSLTMNFSAITGVLATTAGAAGAFEGVPLHIRAKASTAITCTTTVSIFTGTYNVDGLIMQAA